MEKRGLEEIDDTRSQRTSLAFGQLVFREQGAMKLTVQQTRTTQQIATHLRELHFGGNWTSANLKDQLAGVTWQQATTSVCSFHTIAALVYHMNYFIDATLNVLQGGALDAEEKHSYNLQPIRSQRDWEGLLNKTWTDAENLASLIEQMPESQSSGCCGVRVQ